jgi:hypothetical protein
MWYWGKSFTCMTIANDNCGAPPQNGDIKIGNPPPRGGAFPV